MIFIDKGIEKIIQFEESDTAWERQMAEAMLAFLVATLKRFKELEANQ